MRGQSVMVIYGGISAEREISIISSKEIIKSLKRLEYNVIEIDADPNLMKEKPKHDRFSHMADALRYGLYTFETSSTTF